MNNQTGSFVAIAGLIVSALAHYNVVVTQDSVIAVLAGVVTLYGIIHQFVVTKSVTTAARNAGVAGV